MLTSLLVVAEGGLAWTPETFYVAVAIAQLLVILVAFRVMNLPAEYNTFPHAALVAGGTNLLAYFTKDLGIVGILVTGFALFLLLVAVTRGDVLKSIIAWMLTIALYWAVAYGLIEHVEHEEPLHIEQLGGIPYVLMEGGMEPETLDYEEIRDGSEDDEE